MNQEGVLACCAVCNQKTHRRCGRCLNIYYCNTEHQRLDWKRHKSECGPKLPKKGPKSDKLNERSPQNEVRVKNGLEEYHSDAGEEGPVKDIPEEGSASDTRRLKKSKKKNIKEVGKECDAASVSKQNSQTSVANISRSESVASEPTEHNESSVISSVVYTNKDLTRGSAITYEGSSEQEILSESAQLLSTVDFTTPSSSNVLKMVNRTDISVPVVPPYGTEHGRKIKEYPEGSVKGSAAPFGHMPNSYVVDPSDPWYELCQLLIRDMTQYGVCVLDNFLGKERGLMVLKEVIEMHRSGIFRVSILFILHTIILICIGKIKTRHYIYLYLNVVSLSIPLLLP